MSTFNESPIYVSETSAKNMWQDYRVFPDRIELHCRIIFFSKTFVIRGEDIEDVQIHPPFSLGDLFRGKIKCALKLDLSDLNEHVEIHRKTGLFRYLRITPDNPANFVAACRSMKPV